jgi:hypothetical protein
VGLVWVSQLILLVAAADVLVFLQGERDLVPSEQ